MRPLVTYLFWLLLSLPGLNAQNPGIRGRKFVVAVVGTMAPPAFRSYLNSDFNQQRKGPIWSASLQLEYVLNRRTSLAMQMTPGSAYYHDQLYEDYVHEQAALVGFKLRKYSFDRSGNLAPTGGFGEFGWALQSYKSSFYEERPLDGAAPDRTRLSFEPYMILGFGRAWLQRRVWGEYGLQLTYNPLLLPFFDPGLRSRVTQANTITLRVGIGVLN